MLCFSKNFLIFIFLQNPFKLLATGIAGREKDKYPNLNFNKNSSLSSSSGSGKLPLHDDGGLSYHEPKLTEFTRSNAYDIIRKIYAVHTYTTYKHYYIDANSKTKINHEFNLKIFGVEFKEELLKDIIPKNLHEAENDELNKKQKEIFNRICYFKILKMNSSVIKPITAHFLLLNMGFKGEHLLHKLLLLGNIIDSNCKNIVENEFPDGLMLKGRGDHALCILGHLFAFALALGKRIEEYEHENELDKIIALKLLHVEWLNASAKKIFQFLGSNNHNVLLTKVPIEEEKLDNININEFIKIDGEGLIYLNDEQAEEEIKNIGEYYLKTLFADKDFI